MLEILFWLLIGHAVADYPLQGDFLAKAKNETAPIPGVPWWVAMHNHCLIHAGVVWLVTGSVGFALTEYVLHYFIDRAKCRGRTDFLTDQVLHTACKGAYAASVVLVSAMSSC